MIDSATINFLKNLKKNNNKAWFDAHRNQYDEVRASFGIFIDRLIAIHGRKDAKISNLKAKECMFRINRDVRFAKDKTPYKTNLSAYINGDGKKAITSGYYFHCEPGHSFVGGGLWMPMPPELSKVRQEIDYNLADFKKIVESRKFKTVFGALSKSPEYTLTRLPKGYEADNPAAEYLKLKSFVALTNISDTDLSSKTLAKKITNIFETLQPLLEFLNHAIV